MEENNNTNFINGREVVLEVDNIDITFGSGKNLFKAVSGASFNIYKGETFSLVGESGSGKTTIGRAIVRINQLSNGEIRYKGKRISGKLSKAEDKDSFNLVIWIVNVSDPYFK